MNLDELIGIGEVIALTDAFEESGRALQPQVNSRPRELHPMCSACGLVAVEQPGDLCSDCQDGDQASDTELLDDEP